MNYLRVGGVALGGDGYPNATETIALLESHRRLTIRDQAIWLPPETRLWRLASGPWIQRIRLMVRLVVGGLAQAIKLAMRTSRGDRIYLPYPAPLTLWWLSFLPGMWRPHCIADAYISIWDSMIRDRGNGDASSVLSIIVKHFERRSLRAAATVLVDTEANRQQFIEDFGLNRNQVRSLPLAIREDPFVRAAKASGKSHRIRVLFVGTLVPLHGVETILAAMTQLKEKHDIEFRLVGDGQQSGLVEHFLRQVNPSNVTWVRDWLPLDAIAAEIAQADICLGVFGGSGKASRVLPFKLYYALAVGRPIITQSDYSLPEGAKTLPAILITNAPVEQKAKQLASEILALAGDPDRRNALSAAASSYFKEELSGARIVNRWNTLIPSRPEKAGD